MRFSARTIYALEAMIELARSARLGRSVITLNELSENCDIPLNFLVAVLAGLRRADLVESLRGKEGGYRLKRPASGITFGEVVRATASPDSPAMHGNPNNPPDSLVPALIESARQRAEEAAFKVLDALTIDDAVNAATGKRTDMYYI